MTRPFFENKQSVPLKRHGFQGQLVRVDAANESCFKAIAAVIVDTVLQNPVAQLTYVQPLFDRYFQAFSIALPKNNREFVRPRMLIAHQAGHLLASLAFILRQMLVDELIRKPKEYRNAFFNGQVFLKENALRTPETPMNLCAFDALAQVLQARLLIRISEDGKEIALPLCYGKKEHSLINIYLQERVCDISVHHYHLFKPIDFKQSIDIELFQNPSSQDIAIEKQITEADAERLKKYLLHVNRLHTMYKANEMSKETLLSMHIESVGTKDSNGRPKGAVGMEFGSQKYFSQLQNGEAQSLEQFRAQAQTYDEKIVIELIFAVSRALCLGQLSEDQIYNNPENEKFVLP